MTVAELDAGDSCCSGRTDGAGHGARVDLEKKSLLTLTLTCTTLVPHHTAATPPTPPPHHTPRIPQVTCAGPMARRTASTNPPLKLPQHTPTHTNTHHSPPRRPLSPCSRRQPHSAMPVRNRSQARQGQGQDAPSPVQDAPPASSSDRCDSGVAGMATAASVAGRSGPRRELRAGCHCRTGSASGDALEAFLVKVQADPRHPGQHAFLYALPPPLISRQPPACPLSRC